MDGDLVPLQAFSTCTLQTNAWLMVDDAHGIGVLGANGQGSLQVSGFKSDSSTRFDGDIG